MSVSLDWNEVLRRSKEGNPAPENRVLKTEGEWAQLLPAEVFRVTRKAGTERPFSSDSCAVFEPGIYACACCKTELFDANQKFDSGTGWPSFTAPLEHTRIAYIGDFSHGMVRVETICAVCDAHLGHVFPDGPPPTGLRFCMNGVALQKV